MDPVGDQPGRRLPLQASLMGLESVPASARASGSRPMTDSTLAKASAAFRPLATAVRQSLSRSMVAPRARSSISIVRVRPLVMAAAFLAARSVRAKRTSSRGAGSKEARMTDCAGAS